MLAPMSGKTEPAREAKTAEGFASILRAEFALLISLGTIAFFFGTGSRVVEDIAHPLLLVLIFFWLFAVILWAAISVVRHADSLAIKFGEPYGTLILTLSAISIEVVMISTAMLHGANNPTLARDGIFILIQTIRHSQYFMESQDVVTRPGSAHHQLQLRSTPYHAVMLVIYLIAVVLMAEKFAIPLDNGVERFGIPQAFGGAIIAGLVLAPEGLGAIRATLNNHLQRSVNILLGSVLATIGLTIPAVLTISLITRRSVVLGVQGGNLPLLLLTLAVSVVTFTSGKTNVLQGCIHLLLFAVFLLLIFCP